MSQRVHHLERTLLNSLEYNRRESIEIYDLPEIYAEDTVGQDPAGTIMKGREENIAGDKHG